MFLLLQAWKIFVELMLILMSLPSTQMVTLKPTSPIPSPSSLHSHPLEPFQTPDESLVMGGLVMKTRTMMASCMSPQNYQQNQEGREDGMLDQMPYRISFTFIGNLLRCNCYCLIQGIGSLSCLGTSCFKFSRINHELPVFMIIVEV